MDKIGVSSGDVIEVVGKKRTTVRCLPMFAWEKKKGSLLIDGITRENAESELGETAFVHKIECPNGMFVVVSPLKENPTGAETYLKDHLDRQPVRFKEKLVFPYLDKTLEYRVIETFPFPAVTITKDTAIQIIQK